MSFDLDAYLRRIGIADAGPPSPALLDQIVGAHTATIPFENLNIPLGRPIRLDMDALQAKLVQKRRGGYCFEQNTLLQAALQALGFNVESLTARVRRGVPDFVTTPLTHMLLSVSLPEGDFLADAGWGNLTPTAPLRMDSSAVQKTRHEDYRLAPAPDGGKRLQVCIGGEWDTLYVFSGARSYPVDHEMGSWFVSTYPQSIFLHNVMAAKPGNGQRATLFNAAVTTRDLANRKERFVPESPRALRAALADHVGIELDTEEAATVLEAMAAFEGKAAFRMD